MDARVSVCMAVHNGAKYLIPQLQSILAQLGTADEVVIVDDASHDDSVALLRALVDQRVRVFRNDENLGVLPTFERALRLAHGEILFLSDQDDLWLPGKVRTMMEVFASHPEVTLIASDARIIDGSDSVVADSFFARRGRFAAGVLHNLFKNKYLGCTLAFRRSMLERFLPIPPDVPMHDMWFGIINAMFGKTHYIDQPLVAYRRHAANASPAVRASLLQGLVWRWGLIRNLAARVTRLTLGRRSAE